VRCPDRREPIPLTPALSQGEREAKTPLSLRERVAGGRVRVPSDRSKDLAIFPRRDPILEANTMTTETKPTGSDPYLDLVRAFPLRPIRSTEDHDRAIALVNTLADRRGTLRPEVHDYFLVLCLLIERYESEIYPDPTES
jgi:hypothetical protein